jgi:hypothetical protein
VGECGAADVLTRVTQALVLGVVLVADRVRGRPARSRMIVEIVTAVLIASLLIWISRGGARPVY